MLRLAPDDDRMALIANHFGFDIPDVAELTGLGSNAVRDQHDALSPILVSHYRGEDDFRAMKMHLDRVVDAYVRSAYGAANFYESRRQIAKDAKDKWANEHRDEDRMGVDGGENRSDKLVRIAAEHAGKAYALSLVGGDHAQVVAHIAEFYLKRRDMLRAAGSKRGITMSAPTNEDVMALSMAVRERLRERGEVGKEEIVRAAIDQRGESYDLPIAVGDRLRLFSKVRCRAQRAYGSRWLELGSNGDFVDVMGWTDHGLILKNRAGTEGFVPWDSFADRETGRISLGFGHAMTIDAAQGATSDEHINALPRGSSSMTGFTAYVAESRHVHASWTMVGEASVREAETFSRPLGDKTPVTYEDLLNRVAGDMGKHPYKSVAIDLTGEEMKVRQGQIEWIRRERGREEIEETEQQPGERARSRAASVSLRKVPAERWDDLGRNLRRQALIAQDAAERANRLVALGSEKDMVKDRTQTPAPDRSKGRVVRPSTDMGVDHE
ncbi:hypothetical protein GOB83_13330 [Acetobacter fabarum]|uniref:hypothetical protein n=1 Tax=Acetobacter fabarum TaxID=483199 RepID=UPI0014051603|nr:hypothetical protein [Acetobacter fabarum]NHO43143.1 hypothetical protein [Acetobacter fabarum]